VDALEQAILGWLCARYRQAGDRLPPEQELAVTLGVARNTLRRALRRLEDRGEIVRRKGSGTFVARGTEGVLRTEPHARIQMHLEQPASYRSRASRSVVEFSSADLTVVRRAVGSSVGRILGMPSVVYATTVSRTMLADGLRVAAVTEVIHPRALVSRERAFKRALWAGQMAVDALLETGVPVTFSRGKVVPHLLTPLNPDAVALHLSRETPVLVLEETIHGRGDLCLLYARHVFAPDAIDLIVTRTIEPLAIAPVSAPMRPRTGTGS